MGFGQKQGLIPCLRKRFIFGGGCGRIEMLATRKGGKMLVVNLFGVPGAGKSTGALHITYKLKLWGIDAEYINEYAKEKVWEKNLDILKTEQEYIFGKQVHKTRRLQDGVDVAVTDSPIALSAFYNHDEVLGEDFDRVAIRRFNEFDNISYLILRKKDYNPNGRTQTEAESDAMLAPMTEFLEQWGIEYETVPGTEEGYDIIVERILAELGLEPR